MLRFGSASIPQVASICGQHPRSRADIQTIKYHLVQVAYFVYANACHNADLCEVFLGQVHARQACVTLRYRRLVLYDDIQLTCT